MQSYVLSFPRRLVSLLLPALVLFGAGLLLGGVRVSALSCAVGEVEKDGKCVQVDVCDPTVQTVCEPPVNACDPSAPGCTSGDKCDANCLLDKYINPIINFLAISFGLIVTIVIAVGGIQYSSSGDDPQKVAKAKARIFNAIFALVVFIFIYAFLQWIVPGGFL